jgi:hypothetical protein
MYQILEKKQKQNSKMATNIGRICDRITKTKLWEFISIQLCTKFVPFIHNIWDKLGQWDSNTFSRIEVQTQNTFGVTTLWYHYWQVVGGRICG